MGDRDRRGLALLIFGPKKLPDLGSSLGRSITGFKKGLKDTQDEVKTAMKKMRRRSAEAPSPSTTGDHRRHDDCRRAAGRHAPLRRPSTEQS